MYKLVEVQGTRETVTHPSRDMNDLLEDRKAKVRWVLRQVLDNGRQHLEVKSLRNVCRIVVAPAFLRSERM
jgi:hypothetical protein